MTDKGLNALIEDYGDRIKRCDIRIKQIQEEKSELIEKSNRLLKFLK